MLFLKILGTGVYFNSDKLYFSFSILRFLKRQHFDDNTATVFNDKIHCYFMGGYLFNVSQSVKLKPSFLTRLVSGVPLQVDVAANVLWQDKFSLGLSWRWSAAAKAMAGIQTLDGPLVGYSYDFDTTSLENYNSGSHEVFLRFEQFNNQSRIIAPRFFKN